ncbi:hypothetical protein V1509DRAFT_600594 [Lipomyces kononenkoae]
MRPEENPAVDYYAVLELESTECTAEEIKKAYRKLALLYHPDKNQGQLESAEKFKAIVEANDILGDPVKRQIYDRARQNALPRSTQGTPYARHYADQWTNTSKSTPKGTWSWNNNSQREKYGWSNTPSSGYYYTYGRQKPPSSTPSGKSQSFRSATNQYAESPRKPSASEYRNRNSNPATSNTNNRNNANTKQTNSFPFPRAPTAAKSTTTSPKASTERSSPTGPRSWSSSKTAYAMRSGERTYAPSPQKSSGTAASSESNVDPEMPAPKRAETSYPEDPSSTSGSSSSTTTPTSAEELKNCAGQSANKRNEQQSTSEFYNTGSGLKFSSPNFDFTTRPTAKPKVFKTATPTSFHFGVRSKFSDSWNANANGTKSSPTPSPRGSKDDPVDVDSDEDVYMYPNSTVPKPFQEKVNHSADADNNNASGNNKTKKMPETIFVADMWSNAFAKENPFLFDSPSVLQGSKIPTSTRKSKIRPTATNTKLNSAESPQPTVKQEDEVSKGQRAETEAPRPPSEGSESQNTSESQPISTPSPKKRDRHRLKSAMKSRAPLGASSFDDLGLFKTVPPFTQGNGDFKMDDLKKTFPINPENAVPPAAATKTTSVESDIPMDSPRSPTEPRSPKVSSATNAENVTSSQPLPFDRGAPIFTTSQQQQPTSTPIDFHDSRAVFDIEPPVAPIPPTHTINPTETELMDYWQTVLVYQQQWNDYQLKMTLYLNERHQADSQNSMQILSNSGNLDRYIKALQQDDRVRLRWNEALNIHKRVMINLLAVRRIVEGW